jgi:hypothetical protein
MRDRIAGFPLHVRKAHISDAEIQAAIEEARKFLDNESLFEFSRDRRAGEKARRLWAARYIARLGDGVMPRHVRAYVLRLLINHPGERPTFRERDSWIAEAILNTVKRGFAPTRNEASRGKRESACSIVAEALGQLRIDLLERAVEDIWKNYLAAVRRTAAIRGKRRAAVREKQRPKSRTTT